MRVYAVVRNFDLWIQVESGQGMLAGVTIGSTPVPANGNGVHLVNLGIGESFASTELIVAATVLHTQSNSNAGALTISLYQTVPLDPVTGAPVIPIPNPSFKFNPWTFDSIPVDLTGVQQRDVAVALDIL